MISAIYAILNFALNKGYNEKERISDRNIYTSTYQIITNNYDVDFILKFIAYAIFLLAWQIPFLVVMRPKMRRAGNGDEEAVDEIIRM